MNYTLSVSERSTISAFSEAEQLNTTIEGLEWLYGAVPEPASAIVESALTVLKDVRKELLSALLRQAHARTTEQQMSGLIRKIGISKSTQAHTKGDAQRRK